MLALHQHVITDICDSRQCSTTASSAQETTKFELEALGQPAGWHCDSGSIPHQQECTSDSNNHTSAFCQVLHQP